MFAIMTWRCRRLRAVQATATGIGLQLYTIRGAMAADVPGSLKKVADMGYKYLTAGERAERGEAN